MLQYEFQMLSLAHINWERK